MTIDASGGVASWASGTPTNAAPDGASGVPHPDQRNPGAAADPDIEPADAIALDDTAMENDPGVDSDLVALRARCTRFLTGNRRLTPRDMLRRLADRCEADPLAGTPLEVGPDIYGVGAIINGFEERVATLLGKDSAVFMPSGTMAQQIAMRIWSERGTSKNVVFHPLSHLEIHERDGYRVLHGLRGITVGTTALPCTATDVAVIAEPAAAMLIELPQRELGGVLPSWEELVAIVEAARARGMRVHLDGARLWECQPFYGRSLAEIAALFDSVYVSFYKILGGIAGSMLLGDRAFIDESRVWQRRHGGNLISLYPYVLSAEIGFDERLPHIPAYVARAREIAQALDTIDGADVFPKPPPTNMMHVHIRGDRATLEARAHALAASSGVWSFERLAPMPNPNVHTWEFTVGDATMEFDVGELRSIVASVISPTAP